MTTRPQTAHIPPFGLRMQPDLKSRLEESATRNGRSLNAEIVARLEASFPQTAAGKLAATYKSLKETASDVKLGALFSPEEIEMLAGRIMRKLEIDSSDQMEAERKGTQVREAPTTPKAPKTEANLRRPKVGDTKK